MITRHDPLIGRRRSSNSASDIPDCAELIILLEVHLHLRGTRTDVVSKGQRSLPLAWRKRTPQVLEDWRRIGVGKRSHRDLGQLLGVCGRNALRIWECRSGRNSRRGRVSGKLEHESNRAALHSTRGTPRAFWIGIAAIVAIVLRIGINNDSGRRTMATIAAMPIQKA